MRGGWKGLAIVSNATLWYFFSCFLLSGGSKKRSKTTNKISQIKMKYKKSYELLHLSECVKTIISEDNGYK